MSLKYGPSVMAIPGPSVMPERVLRAMHRSSPNIYEGELIELTDTLFPDLKTVVGTKFDAAIYIANGHGVWEGVIKNTLNAGDKALVISTGRFAMGWAELAATHDIDVQILEFGMQGHAEADKLEEILRQDAKGEIKAVLTVQADTASSVINNIQNLRAAIDNAKHDALFMVDCIASLACDHYEMDKWGVDVTVAACQKGLMTPPGLGFIFYNDKAELAQKRTSPGFYWDWLPRSRPDMFYQQFAGTAPTHHLYGLREALDMLVHEEGLDNAWARHKTIAAAVWAAIDAWGENGDIRLNIPHSEHRTTAVTTVATGKGDAKRIRQWCEDEAGMTLGIGLGFEVAGPNEYDRHFRIGHMGHQNAPMIMGILGTLDCALKALDIPHGGGALTAASSVLSKHKK